MQQNVTNLDNFVYFLGKVVLVSAGISLVWSRAHPLRQGWSVEN